MVNAKKAAKKSPGRPKKPDDEKLEQFSIRLPPKLKFGLDLLARAQHRSLSQAVEWALQVGLNNHELGYAGTDEIETIGSVIDRAWKSDTESGRLLSIYRHAPSLLTFEDFKTCELVERSFQASQITELDPMPKASKEITPEEYREWDEQRRANEAKRNVIFYRWVDATWTILKSIAIELTNSGKSTQDVHLLFAMGLKGFHMFDQFDILDFMAEYIERGEIPPEEIATRANEIIEKNANRNNASDGSVRL